jgi:recombination protein RecR
MMSFIMIGTEIENLITLLSKLPGIGPRSARRMALSLLRHRQSVMMPLADAISTAAQVIKTCEICHNLDTVSPCSICCDISRDKSEICVVEQIADLWALERTGSYRGQYHVLGGTLSALDGIGPEDLAIPALVTRARDYQAREVIIALNATIDGQTTAHYLTNSLKDCHVTVTRLAHGVPIGGELDYLDDGTITTALKSRAEF